MSLINQMLRDLEHRRTAEAGASPLGGLSASASSPGRSLHLSINYTTLSVVVALMFVGGVLVAYLLGSQQQMAFAENAAPAMQEKDVSMVVENIVEPDAASKVKQEKAVAKKLPVLVAEQSLPLEKSREPSAAVKTNKTIKSKAVTAKPTVVAKAAPVQKESQPEEAVVEQPTAVVIKPAAENAPELLSNKANEDINKTIRPLTDEQQAQLAFQRAIKLLGQGKQQRAQLELADTLTILPTHARARETQAALLLNEGRVSEAANSLREGLQLVPQATPLAKLYARILVDQGGTRDAVTVLERARPAVSADPDYYALLAALYRQEKKYAQAARVYQQILLQRPGVASWWMGLALSQDAMGEKPQALEAFQRAQRVGGLSAQVLQYVQSRIVALTPVAPVTAQSDNDFDEFGE